VVGYNTWAYLAALIVGVLLILVAPQLLRRSSEGLRKQPWQVLAVGAMGAILAIPLVILLAVTVFGIPLALITLALWFVGVYLAKFFVGYSVGSRLIAWSQQETKSTPNMYLSMFVGLSVYYLLRLVPGFGLLVGLLTTTFGLGMLLTLYNRPVKKTVNT
jgi:divalent metal cation (Fe/Co/Zn/Cd) transporter